jgi:hypothetical protein
MKIRGFRDWRKIVRDRDVWKIILKEARNLRGLEEKKKSFNDQNDRVQYFIVGEHCLVWYFL